jgi:hypothetical protein
MLWICLDREACATSPFALSKVEKVRRKVCQPIVLVIFACGAEGS